MNLGRTDSIGGLSRGVSLDTELGRVPTGTTLSRTPQCTSRLGEDLVGQTQVGGHSSMRFPSLLGLLKIRTAKSWKYWLAKIGTSACELIERKCSTQ
jgi:hypothetical protein